MSCEMADCINIGEYNHNCLTCTRFKIERKDNYRSKAQIDEFVKRMHKFSAYKAKRQVMPNESSRNATQ